MDFYITTDAHIRISQYLQLKDYLNYKASCSTIYESLCESVIPKVHIYDGSDDVVLYKFWHVVIEYTTMITQDDIDKIASSCNKTNVRIIIESINERFFELDFSGLRIFHCHTIIKHADVGFQAHLSYYVSVKDIMNHIVSDWYVFDDCWNNLDSDCLSIGYIGKRNKWGVKRYVFIYDKAHKEICRRKRVKHTGKENIKKHKNAILLKMWDDRKKHINNKEYVFNGMIIAGRKPLGFIIDTKKGINKQGLDSLTNTKTLIKSLEFVKTDNALFQTIMDIIVPHSLTITDMPDHYVLREGVVKLTLTGYNNSANYLIQIPESVQKLNIENDQRLNISKNNITVLTITTHHVNMLKYFYMLRHLTIKISNTRRAEVPYTSYLMCKLETLTIICQVNDECYMESIILLIRDAYHRNNHVSIILQTVDEPTLIIKNGIIELLNIGLKHVPIKKRVPLHTLILLEDLESIFPINIAHIHIAYSDGYYNKKILHKIFLYKISHVSITRGKMYEIKNLNPSAIKNIFMIHNFIYDTSELQNTTCYTVPILKIGEIELPVNITTLIISFKNIEDWVVDESVFNQLQQSIKLVKFVLHSYDSLQKLDSLTYASTVSAKLSQVINAVPSNKAVVIYDVHSRNTIQNLDVTRYIKLQCSTMYY